VYSNELGLAEIQKGQRAEAIGNFGVAEKAYRGAIEASPDSVKALVLLSRILSHQRRHEEVVGLMRKAISIKSDAPANWYVKLGVSLAATGQLTEAIGAYDRAIELDPEKSAWSAAVAELRRQKIGGAQDFVQTSAVFYNDLYAASEKYMRGGDETVYLPMWQRITELIGQQEVAEVLDLGCGPGQFAEFFLACLPGIRYRGVDISQVAIDQARRRVPPAEFICADIFASDWLIELDEVKAGVVCTEVLEHIERDQDLLKLLPAGAPIYCSVPSFHAFGHLRTFFSPQQVMERYEAYVSNMVVEAFPLPSKQQLFLFHGILR